MWSCVVIFPCEVSGAWRPCRGFNDQGYCQRVQKLCTNMDYRAGSFVVVELLVKSQVINSSRLRLRL